MKPFSVVLLALFCAPSLRGADSTACSLLGRRAIGGDLEVAVSLEAPRTLQQRHASERLLLDMGDCPAEFVAAVGEYFKRIPLGRFVLVWRDDLQRDLESRQTPPGLQTAMARALNTPPPAQSNIYQVFADALRDLVPKTSGSPTWEPCSALGAYTMQVLAEEYKDRGGEFGGDLMAHTLLRLTTCPAAALSAMTANPDLLKELVSAGHDSPFWGDIEGLPEMRAIKKELVLRLRQYRPQAANAEVYQRLLKGIEEVCVDVIDYEPLPPPCPLNDQRRYKPMNANNGVK